MGWGEEASINAVEVRVIFDDWSTEGAGIDGPHCRIRTSDVTAQSIDQGSTLIIRNRTFIVRGVQRDGTGVARLILWEDGT